MTYDEVRDAAQMNELDGYIDVFVEACRRVKPPPKTGGRPTVILFPGGMGSTLLRSPFPNDGTVPAKDDFENVWLHLRTFAGAARLLGLTDKEHGYHEWDDHIVIASGPIHLFGEIPYVEFESWCEGHGVGLFTFGYDWRRPIADVARFFAERFVPRFQQRVKRECGYDPLENLSLVGHSLGGMVVNWLLRRYGGAMPKLRHAITVATPFYGYPSQIGRWFKGEPILNYMGMATMVEVVSSQPALYTLNYLDGPTYDALADALANDTGYELDDYPCKDYVAHSTRADPYNPGTFGGKVRYPEQGATGFSPQELASGYATFKELCAPMAESLSKKFFNVRGVQDKRRTLGGLWWDWIDPDFNVYGHTPIWRDRDMYYVLGDGVIPAWSARLVRVTPQEQKDNVCTVNIGDDSHMFMMECAPVQDEVGKILGVKARAGHKRKRSQTRAVAPEDETIAFAVRIYEHFKHLENPMLVNDDDVAEFLALARVSKAKALSIARRMYVMLHEPVVA